jgi:hypothetical protein
MFMQTRVQGHWIGCLYFFLAVFSGFAHDMYGQNWVDSWIQATFVNYRWTTSSAAYDYVVRLTEDALCSCWHLSCRQFISMYTMQLQELYSIFFTISNSLALTSALNSAREFHGLWLARELRLDLNGAHCHGLLV